MWTVRMQTSCTVTSHMEVAVFGLDIGQSGGGELNYGLQK